MSNSFTHIDKNGDPSMVDVGSKSITKREATARSIVTLPPEAVSYTHLTLPTTPYV